jgi:16S rRNA (guanine527-N7)-methyltransferase
MRDIVWFKNIFSINGFNIDDIKLKQLSDYGNLLIQKNHEVNLISSKSEGNIWEEHILHSLSFLLKVKINEKAKILDLGAGGGLPGIPLIIIYPELRITLLDSTQKKIIADKEMISEMGLKGIGAISGRAEELTSETELIEKYDYVISRAVGQLDKLFEWSLPFLNKASIESEGIIPTGTILALKGGDLSEEIKKVNRNKHFDKLEVINIDFAGSEELFNPDKKLVIMYPKRP